MKIFKNLSLGPMRLRHKKPKTESWAKRHGLSGFTVIELLVSMAIFAVVISITSIIFIRSLRAQRAIVKLIEVNENISITIERMSREIRTGFGFNDGSGESLEYINARGEEIEYFLEDNRIMQSTNGLSIPLTGRGVYVRVLNFEDHDDLSLDVDRITITLTVGLPEDTQDISEIETRIQTTISVRPLNYPLLDDDE